MSKKELEIKEAKKAKKAIKILRDYCDNCDNCDNCDETIKKWCTEKEKLESTLPCEWKV